MQGGYGHNFRAPKADVHKFAMVPREDIPRSSFRSPNQFKLTFSASNLIPVLCEEVLPGDTWNVSMTAFCRVSTPLFPLMDNMDLESFFFFCPARILWQHWTNFMGEQPSTPSDSISYTIPQIVSPASGFVAFSLYDYFGLPGVGQIGAGNTTSVNALPLRAYALIYNQWFRDQNLQNAMGTGATNVVGDIGDGPDPYTNYTIQQANKRHDYFTSNLPWTQKGGVAVSLPLGTTAVVKTSATEAFTGAQTPMIFRTFSGGTIPNATNDQLTLAGAAPAGANLSYVSGGTGGAPAGGVYATNLYADLSTATAATINQLRLAYETQRFLERDARHGTRYQELVYAHFGVMGADARYQRPEYLGGGRSPVSMAPVPQTTATGLTGGSTPLGSLAAVGTSILRTHGFRQSFTEHGYLIGLITVRADPVYQQGTRRLWTRSTRYDFYDPVFAHLGEQAVRQDEIYTVGVPATDTAAFGYQERWAEYRYRPSMVAGAFRSTYATPLDAWHLAEKFASAPALNGSFITDKTSVTLARNLAAGAAANNEQFLADILFDVVYARPMPTYSVPGWSGRF